MGVGIVVIVLICKNLGFVGRVEQKLSRLRLSNDVVKITLNKALGLMELFTWLLSLCFCELYVTSPIFLLLPYRVQEINIEHRN